MFCSRGFFVSFLSSFEPLRVATRFPLLSVRYTFFFLRPGIRHAQQHRFVFMTHRSIFRISMSSASAL